MDTNVVGNRDLAAQQVNPHSPKKSLVTNLFFTCVNDDVLRQVSHINKCLVAHLTLVRADVVVMANVIGQLTRLHKPAQKHIYDISSHLLY